MHKFKGVTFLLLFAPALWAQEVVVSAQLKWENKANALLCSGCVADWEGTGWTAFAKTIEAPQAGMSYQIRIENAQWEALPRTQRLALPKSPLPAPFVEAGTMAGRPMLRLAVVPFRQNAGGWERLVSGQIKAVPVAAEPTMQQRSLKTALVPHLASGIWKKVTVGKSGVYKITTQLLQDLGVDPSTTNPDQVRILGSWGSPLPELVGAPRPDGLQEIPAKRVHNGNGSFESNEYILFYAEGPHTWTYSGTEFRHRYNPYVENNAFFISVTQGTGQNVPQAVIEAGPANQTVTSFLDYQFLEEDEENLVGTGRKWFGDVFDFTLSYNYSFSFPNRLPNEQVTVRLAGAGRSSVPNTSLQLRHAGQLVLNQNFIAVSGLNGASYMAESETVGSHLASGNTLTYTLTYNQNGNVAAVAWLDYLEVYAKRQLSMAGVNELQFRQVDHLGNGTVVDYQIANAPADLEVWEITNPLAPKRMVLSFAGGTASFIASADSVRQFVALTGNSFPTPLASGNVPNQNLAGSPATDMVIVTAAPLLSAADRLAEHHRNHDNLRVLVTSIEEVYNEFSSGKQDPAAIRDFMVYLYNQYPTDRPKYLLLLGDASYDYKNRIQNNVNLVPTWESLPSGSLSSSFCTDDFFGFLDPAEGLNTGVTAFTGFLDLGIGRFPVQNLTQANRAVDKVIKYATDKSGMLPWRNRMLFVSDDIDRGNGWEKDLFDAADLSAETSRLTNSNINVDKVYADAYEQEVTAGTQRYPGVRNDIFRKVQQGQMALTYVGHGGEIGWGSERFLQNADIEGWTNATGQPLITTITCEFARFDDPKRVSAGELAFLNSRGGAIALLSTQRVVYAFDNTLNLSVEIMDTLCAVNGGEVLTLGQVTQYVKNGNNSNDRNRFSLIGDPALKLAFPKYKVLTDSINGVAITNPTDTLKALAYITVSGHVEDHGGSLLSGFDGVVNPVIYDKALTKTTLVNDGEGNPLPFRLQNNVLYKGNASVSNGRFRFSFIVPLDIAYNIGLGRISYYAQNGVEDAAGNFEQLYVGGFNANAPADNQGPVVNLYMNDVRFVPGGITDENPAMLALVVDSSGINTVGNGIGHDLVAVLDENTENSYILNDYYEADTNSFQSGRIRYPFYKLPTGRHTLSVRVWDVYNNPSTAKTDFVVADRADLALEHVLNYPNPFTTYTEFHFEHNRANQPLDVQVQIFTVNGKLVKTLNQQMVPAGNRVTSISWDGRDDFGDLIGKGVYVYRLRVRSILDQKDAEVYEKLVILR